MQCSCESTRYETTEAKEKSPNSDDTFVGHNDICERS